MSLLAVEGLSISYGDLYAVREVSFAVDEGAVFVLLGANGAGKTSILRAISGLVPARGGTIVAEGRSIGGLRPHQVARAGISHVPEGRRIFAHLTVEENLIVSFLSGRAPVERPAALAAVFKLFPRLAERRAQAGGTLSGGEQQMLAIGRALMANPRVLLMDEPSEGLAPQIVAEVMSTIRKLKESGLSIVLVEQSPKLAFDIADDIVILNSGRVAVVSTAAALKADGVDLRQHLGVF